MSEYIELTDEVRADEPVAWMVFTIGDAIHEYRIFTDKRSADAFSLRMAEVSEDGESQVYPLWAATPGAKPVRFAGGKRR